MVEALVAVSVAVATCVALAFDDATETPVAPVLYGYAALATLGMTAVGYISAALGVGVALVLALMLARWWWSRHRNQHHGL